MMANLQPGLLWISPCLNKPGQKEDNFEQVLSFDA